MMSDFTSHKLSDVVINVIDNRGKTPPRTDEPTSYELLEVNSLKGTSKHPNYYVVKKYVSKETYENWFRKGHPKSGDVLISTVGSIGEVALSEGRGCIAQNIVALQTNKSILDSEYLYYLFTSDMMKNVFNALNISSVQPSIKVPHLLAQEVKLPSVATQKEVVKVLKCLDNKINNNKAMNQTLEKLAQRIFKSWFIDFDPVKANKEGLPFDGLSPEIQALFPSEFEDSELGMIPKGWEVSNIEKYATNVRKNIKKGDIDSDMPYLGLEHINRKCLSVYEHGLGESVTSNKSQFQVNDILLGKLRPYFHKVGIPNFDGVCSTDILVVRPKESFYFEYALNVIYQDRLIDHLTRCSSGTRMPRAKWADVTDYQLATPLEDSIFKAFSKITSPLYQRLLNNCNEVDILSKLRDRLLPKLISGQISVGEATQELAEAV